MKLLDHLCAWNNSTRVHIFPLAKLAIPLIFTGIVQSIPYFSINIFLASLGQSILAAGALVNSMEATLIVILFGTLGSISVLVSHKAGAKDEIAIAAILRDGLLLSLILSVILFYIYTLMSSIFLFLGQSPVVVNHAYHYLRALSFGLFPSLSIVVLLEMIIGLGNYKLTLLFNIILASLNVFFSYLFIFGKFGFPALGIAGAGWGVTSSETIACLLFFIILLNKKKYNFFLNNFFIIQEPLF